LLIHDLINLQNFTCVAVVSREISSVLSRLTKSFAKFSQISPRKTVGPIHQAVVGHLEHLDDINF